jgi:HEAT repeat protein
MFSEVEVGSTEFNRGVSVLLNALKDPAEEVRYFALFALSATGYLPLISAMKELLSDHTPVPGWRGTVADEAKDAIEWLETVHASRVRRGKPDH